MIIKIMENVYDTVKNAVSQFLSEGDDKPDQTKIDAIVYATAIAIKSYVDLDSLDEESSYKIEDHIDNYDMVLDMLIKSVMKSNIIHTKDQNLCGAYYAVPTEKNFNRLYKKYHAMCHRTAHRITKDPDLANDTTSLVFEKIFRLSQSNNFVFDYSKPHRSYISTMVSNTAKQLLRKNRSLVLPEYKDSTDVMAIMQSGMDYQEWNNTKDSTDLTVEMSDVIMSISNQNRFPMFMDSVNGVGNVDIGEQYNTSPKAAKTAIHRVRKTLRKKYASLYAYKLWVNGELDENYTGDLANYHQDTGETIHQLSMINGEIHGDVIRRDAYGFLLSIASYHMGFKHGRYAEFDRVTMYDDKSKKRAYGKLGHYDVKVIEGEYTANKESGIWTMYNAGKKDRTIEYNDDGTPGIVKFWKNGICVSSKLLSLDQSK